MADAPKMLGAAQFRTLLDHVPTRVALIGRDRRYYYVNAENAAFLERDADSFLGLDWGDVIGPAALEIARIHADRALAGETARFENWFSYAGQGPRFNRSVYTPHRGADGAVDGFLLFARDMTELKLGEAELDRQMLALQASETMKAAVIASALDCIVVIDEDACVVDFNPAAERTFGYARAVALGQPITQLIVPSDLKQQSAHPLIGFQTAGLTSMIGRRIEMEAMHADGRVFPVELAIAEVSLPGRRLFTAYIRDLTAAKAAEAEIARQRDELQQSEKMAAFGSLLAGVAHELNNPLAIVIGNALMLREDAAAMGALGLEERARIIEAAADRCGRIIRTFLAMARQRKTTLRPVGIGQVITGALDLLSYGLRSDSVAVTVDLPATMPDAMGDPDQLNQVLVNLITNAHQALTATDGPRHIHIGAALENDWIKVTVEDNGPGVPEDLRRHIFDPFFTTKPVGVGTGIGLAVSRGIVESHGGSLMLAEMDNPGARFAIRLPRAISAE